MECCFSSICPNDLIASEFALLANTTTTGKQREQTAHYNNNNNQHHFEPSDITHQLNSSTCSSSSSSSSSSSCSDLDLEQIKPELMAVAAEVANEFSSVHFPATSVASLDSSTAFYQAAPHTQHITHMQQQQPSQLFQIQNINFKPVFIFSLNLFRYL